LRRGHDHVFFTNSGSEAVDTALKIALAYHRVRGEGTRTRLIGRERGYHGVGFGGISVGGIVGNRKMFGTMLPASTICPHARSRPQRLHARRAGPWRRTGRRAGAARRAARRLDHRRRHRRAHGRLDRRAHPAQGLSAAAARDLRPSTASC
jgi:adenosylmethionine-8-amino-7-oxononanoate aminotransferase